MRAFFLLNRSLCPFAKWDRDVCCQTFVVVVGLAKVNKDKNCLALIMGAALVHLFVVKIKTSDL